jgi:hypothetical protein
MAAKLHEPAEQENFDAEVRPLLSSDTSTSESSTSRRS